MNEFDLVMSQLKGIDEPAIHHVANLRILEDQLNLDVEQLISLAHDIPKQESSIAFSNGFLAKLRSSLNCSPLKSRMRIRLVLN